MSVEDFDSDIDENEESEMIKMHLVKQFMSLISGKQRQLRQCLMYLVVLMNVSSLRWY